MKRFIQGLLVTLLIIGNVSAKTYSSKTFLMPRPHGMNMAMEYTTWHKHTAMIDDDKFGGSFQITGFYEESDNKRDLGEYFGVRNWGNGCKVEDFITVVPSWSEEHQPKHIAAEFLFHTYNNRTAPPITLADKLTWRPYREAYGIRLDYHQKLDKILRGLFFKINIPVIHVKTSMGWSSSCCNSCGTGCSNNNYCVKQHLANTDGTLTSTEKSLADYLTGGVSNNVPKDKQVALCKAKIHNGKSETGVADIELMLGYNFLYEKEKHMNVSIGLIIPTGNEPDGEYLWEPIVGNAGHWAFGAGVDAAFRIWKDKNKSLDFLFAGNYRYLFESREARTMGFVWPGGANLAANGWAGKRALYGHWLLGAKKGDTFATPMANFLTRDLRVTPGSHFEGITQLAFNWCEWTFDLGYNLFVRTADDVRLIINPCSTSCSTGCCAGEYNGWQNDTYAVAKTNWQTDSAFGDSYVYYDSTDWINYEHLCLDACRQPSVVTHKIYGGIGYTYEGWTYPILFGVGGSYEFETDNDCLETWALWAKVGMTF